eukprot:300023-Amphidinium_carterae.1
MGAFMTRWFIWKHVHNFKGRARFAFSTKHHGSDAELSCNLTTWTIHTHLRVGKQVAPLKAITLSWPHSTLSSRGVTNQVYMPVFTIHWTRKPLPN